MDRIKFSKLSKIAEEISRCRICKRNKVGKAVPGEGNSNAKVVFVGEAPGRKESETGRPFVGRAGQILRRMIRDCGLKEEGVYITSAVKYFPKRLTPDSSDIEHGRKHLFDQISVIKPKMVVLLGNVAAQAVLKEKFQISKVHGKLVKGDGISYFITYHPAAMLHNPKVKMEIEKDFRKFKKLL